MPSLYSALMHCIVTAGPTYEPLDNVRRLTNFSTGRLGSELANYLTEHGHKVTLLIGEQATCRGPRNAARTLTFTTTANLREQLQALSGEQVDAVFHAAAVSDFSFGKVWLRSKAGELSEVNAGKISTRQGPYLAELLPTPKIIRALRGWFPTARIVGWKYEVDGDRPEVIGAAEQQMSESATDACVANGPAYGRGFGLVPRSGEVLHLDTAAALFHELEGRLH